MNYNLFLNKNYRRVNNKRYKLIIRKKSSRAFLLPSVLSVTLIAALFAVLIYSNSDLIPEQLALTGTESDNKQTTVLALPEIDYNSEPEPQTIAYIEPETELQHAADSAVSAAKKEHFKNPSPVSGLKSDLIVESKETVQSQNSQPSEKINVLSDVINVAAQNKKAESVSASTMLAIEKRETTQRSKNKNPGNTSEQNKSTHIRTVVVQKGDTLSGIFKRQSLSNSTLYKILNSSKEAKRLTRIKPGQELVITVDNHNELKKLHFALDKVDTLVINRKGKQFVAHIDSKDVETRQQFASGTINNSLFSAGNKASLSSSLIMQLARIFGWDIDFALDIRKGDSFSVLYEEQYIDDDKIANGSILSAEFVNQGKVYKAIRYTDTSGHTDYYSEKGLSMRKAFLRTPVEFSRISSRFSSGRKHPVLNRIRAHKGVDYAASRGTPIKAVGDGKVIFKGNKGGYGRVIILQHGSKYTTLYAHMNSYNKKIKHGSRVKQGQTIGYIGSSGLATGPHLHYEFRVNGKHRNPLTVPLPSAAPIAKKYRTDFQSAADTLISKLKLRKQQTVALKD